MAEWYVSGSEPEGDEEGVHDGTESLEIGGLQIPPSKVLELMQRVEKRKTLELDCLSGVHHRQKRTKKRKRKKNKAVSSPSEAAVMGGGGGSRVNVEEVSETASEIRSNTSTTATECRDSRRPNLAMFDPTFDPELDDSLSTTVKLVKTKKAPPTHKQRDKKLASLERITADAIKRKQKWHKHQQSVTNQEPMIAEKYHQIQQLTPPPSLHSNQSHLDGTSTVQENPVISFDTHMEVDNGYPQEEITRPKMKELPSFRFDEDEDEDMMSEVDMKFSILSQINRVEKLLDSEGLT